MSIQLKLILVTILILGISGKFSEQPSYSFQAWNFTNTDMLMNAILATDDDKFITVSFNQTSNKYHQIVYNLDGTVVCEEYYPFYLGFFAWPAHTSGLFLNPVNKTLLKANTSCGNLSYVTDIVSTDFAGVSFSHTSKDSYIALSFSTSKLFEYNLVSGTNKEFSINTTLQEVRSIDYTPDHNYLFAAADYNSNDKFNIIVFDTSSGNRTHSIPTNLTFAKGNPDGNGFLASDEKDNILYNVDKDGNKKQIWKPQNSSNPQEIPFAFCTDDIKLLTMKEIGNQTDVKIEIFSYDTDSGALSQTFEINFIPLKQFIYCNNDYLSLIDNTGKAHIFKYTHQSASLPVWAIIVIVVGSLLIVGGIVGVIIYKKKQSKQAGGYQQFSNEERSRNGL